MKKSKKLISLLLAVVMACTAAFGVLPAAYAAENGVTYTATYRAPATRGEYEAILEDADTLIANNLFTGSTMQSLWSIAPSLSALVNEGTTGQGWGNSSQASYYEYFAPEYFSDLAAFMEANGYSTVTAAVLTGTADDPATTDVDETAVGYFQEYPIVIDTPEEFTAAVDQFIDAVAVDNIALTVGFALMMMPSGDMGLGLVSGLNDVVTALGLDNSGFDNQTLWTMFLTQQGSVIRQYLKGIVHSLVPDTAEGVMNMLKNISVPENRVKLYSGINAIFSNINDLITMLSSSLSGLGIDVSELQGTINDVYAQIQALPTEEIVVNGEAQTVFDYNGILNYVVNDVLAPSLLGSLDGSVANIVNGLLGDKDLISFGTNTGLVKFDAINTANLANAGDEVDVLNVVLHYLYTNMNKLSNKVLLSIVNLIGGSVLPEEVATILNAVVKDSEQEAVVAIADVLDDLANYVAPQTISIDQGSDATLAAVKSGSMYSGSLQLSATVGPKDAEDKSVSWSSSNENVKVDENGVVSYRGTLDVPFDVVITATANANTAVTDIITVKVQKAAVTSVTLDQTVASLYEGATLQVNAAVQPAGAEYDAMVWTSSDESVATVADGLVTAVAPGTATITATVDGVVSASCVINVSADKSALNALLAQVEGMDLNAGDYDATLWAAYEAALAAAQDVAADDLATQAAVDKATANLQAALKALPVAPDLTSVTVVPVNAADEKDGSVIYHKTPWYKTWMSQTVDLALEYTEGAQIVSVQWVAANWSASKPQAKIENASDDGATIRPTFGIGPRSFWVQAVVTDANGNTVKSDPVKVRFYNWDWQK